MSSTKISVQLWRYYSIDTHCFLSTVGVWKSVFYTIHETTIAQIFKCWTSGLIFCNLPHKYCWPHLASIYSSSKHTVAGLDYVDTWEWSWMMQSILRVTGTYMVIKILSMHIPFSLNTALSVPPPPSLLSTLSSSVFFCAFCPAQRLSDVQICTPTIGPKWMNSQNPAVIGHRGGTDGLTARLGLDRTPAPASYALSEIKRTSKQPAEEGGQKEEGEKKKR